MTPQPTIKEFKCPTCGFALPERAKQNQLIKCPACNTTLFISDWTIGETKDNATVATPTRVYTMSRLIAKDDVCNVYACAFSVEGKPYQGLFRVARDAGDNDLVQNEARALYHFQATPNYDDFRAFLPSILESFVYQDERAAVAGRQARQVNIVTLHTHIASPDELYSLEDVRGYYTGGIDTKDMAWMWRRLLNVLGYAHKNGIIHGAVLPSHVLIEPKDHKLALVGWGFSVRDAKANQRRLPAMSVSYESWYPPEVGEKAIPTPSLDLNMAARCMLYLMGLDPLNDSPAHYNLDPALGQYFAKFLHARPRQRPQDAWDALDEFDRIIESLWGARTFREFTLPAKL